MWVEHPQLAVTHASQLALYKTAGWVNQCRVRQELVDIMLATSLNTAQPVELEAYDRNCGLFPWPRRWRMVWIDFEHYQWAVVTDGVLLVGDVDTLDGSCIMSEHVKGMKIEDDVLCEWVHTIMFGVLEYKTRRRSIDFNRVHKSNDGYLTIWH